MSKVVNDIYVVHVIPSQEKIVFSSHGPALKRFKLESTRKFGSVALWHGPKWTRLYATPYYPEMLTEPYLKEWAR